MSDILHCISSKVKAKVLTKPSRSFPSPPLTALFSPSHFQFVFSLVFTETGSCYTVQTATESSCLIQASGKLQADIYIHLASLSLSLSPLIRQTGHFSFKTSTLHTCSSPMLLTPASDILLVLLSPLHSSLCAWVTLSRLQETPLSMQSHVLAGPFSCYLRAHILVYNI